MAVKPILTEPNKLLRQVSKPVDKVTIVEQKLMNDMLDTMYAANGIGLAAIQIGIPKRIIVMDLSKDQEKKNQDILLIQLLKRKMRKKQPTKRAVCQFLINLLKLKDQVNVM